MKKIISFCLVLIIVSCCSVLTINVAAYTGNDSQTYAEKIKLNTTYKDNIWGSTDKDWYIFTTTTNGVINFVFSHEYTNEDLPYSCWEVVLYKENMERIHSWEYTGSWDGAGNRPDSIKERTIGLPAGKYYIKITDSDWLSDVPYYFSVDFSKQTVWETELNNSKSYADLIKVNKTYYGNLHNEYDKDWYSFSIPKDGILQLNFAHDYVDNYDYCWYVSLRTSSQSIINSWEYRGNYKKNIKEGSIGLPAGTYYIQINDSDSYSNVNYFFKLKFTESNVWETELNNSKDAADKLKLNKFKYGSLHAQNDVDYFKVTVSKSGKYVFNFAHDYVNSSNSYWVVALLDNNLKQIDYMALRGQKTDVIKSKVTYLTKGTYYLMVKKGKSYTSMANYRVMLSEHLAEPALKKVYNGPNGIGFSWKPINNADGYVICRKEGNGSWKRLAVVSGTSESSYVDKALKAGVKYTYTVKAYKGDAYSYYSEAGLPIVRLSKAGITGLYSVSNGVRITWHKTTGAAGYMIYRSTGNGVFTKIATVKGYDSVSYIDKTAKKGVKYIYRTKAYNGASVSPTSDPKSIKR